MSDFKILIHEGGPRPAESIVQYPTGASARKPVKPGAEPPVPELVAGKIVGQEGRAFRVELTEPPQFLKAFSRGRQVLVFRMPNLEKPFLVSEAYLAERKNWTFSPCTICGFSELFEPPSQILAASLDIHRPELVNGFSWRCPLPGCTGTIVVHRSLSGPGVVTAGSRSAFGPAFLEFFSEPWGKAVVGGVALTAYGVVFTGLSYFLRDPQTGTFVVYTRALVAGPIITFFGGVYWYFAR